MKLFVTGGAGFIGSNFIRYWLKQYPEDHILSLDALTYAGNLENLSDQKHHISRFHYISTCEVYGDLPLNSPEKFTEHSPYRTNTPYNTSKAAADLIVQAYFKTLALPMTISNCCNNYGCYQGGIRCQKVIS